MSRLFDPFTVGALHLPNRIMRSATAERLADPETGAPLPRLRALYRTLAEGGVALIVTGHAYVHRTGKAHPEMSSIAADDLIPPWRETIRPAQQAGARVMMQLNHSGASCDPAVTPLPISPSGVATNSLVKPQQMTEEELLSIVAAFGQAARRAREAGFDGVQFHGAHGYLITQFLTPATNHRDDRWGGDAERRLTFLRAAVAEVRRQVGGDFPVWIKLGIAGSKESGFALLEGAHAAQVCASCGIDCIEISIALGAPEELDTHGEAPLLPLARGIRQAVGPSYPLALVNGLRSRAVMEELLEGDLVQLVSMCRPLIAEPGLPMKLRDGRSSRAACLSCDHCWPERPAEGIACRNAKVQEALR
jgi:2,4-dienoyl-CoA reductase-like NADH-dependent reductase (Old Yellow Enzyme family)